MTAAMEWQLAAAAMRGDGGAFAALYERYAAEVRSYIAGRARGSLRNEIDDLTHDTFLRAFGRKHDLTFTGRPFSAYLVTIARNLLADRARSGHHRLSVPLDDFADFDEPDDSDPATETLLTELADALRGAMAGLTDQQRQVLECRFWRGMSVADTAEQVGITDGAVKATQTRAVRQLARDERVRGVIAPW